MRWRTRRWCTRLLDRAAGLATSPSLAYVIVCFVACLASLASWGVGLIVGAIVARETANVCLRRGIKVHYPLLVAAAFSGLVVWHQGLSSSVGLLIATPNHFLADSIGVIPVSETIFSYWNITIVVIIVATLPFVMMLLRPSNAECVPIARELEKEDEADAHEQGETGERSTPAQMLENARSINLLLGGTGFVFLVLHFFGRGGSLNINIVNFSFLTLGFLLTRSPVHYVRLITHGGRTLGPILLQFPFYGGIMGMILDSGFAQILASWFVAISTPQTLPFWSLISGGIINMFVPSGGGQWAVQGPVMTEAAKTIGADIPRVAMGVAMRDQWTNMIQPFWTIPALAIAGLHVRDVMGYTVITCIWTGIIFSLGLLFL